MNGARASLLLLCAAACAGCNNNKTSDTQVADAMTAPMAMPMADAGATAAPSAMPASARGPVWTLPAIRSGEPLSAARFKLSVDDRSLLLDGEKVLPLPADGSAGFDAEYKHGGKNPLFNLAPLADAITRGRAANGVDANSARLELGPKVTYRMLTEILFTLGQTDVNRWAIVAPSAGGAVPAGELAEIRVVPPKLGAAGDAGPPKGPTLGLTIISTKDGMGLKARGGNVAPGCTDTGAGLTFKNGDAGDRLAELAPCLRKLKGLAPEFAEEKTVTFTASPGASFSDVIAIVDVARGEKRELFPDVMFGIAH